MENVVYLVVFVALMATVYGRFVATRNDALLADAERSHNLMENLILALVCFLCLVISAEVFLHWTPWLTPADALWSMIPAVLWSGGTGLATLLPHVYQTLLAEMQLVSASLSVFCVVVAMVVAVRREGATHP
jgi:hypothetical protein